MLNRSVFFVVFSLLIYWPTAYAASPLKVVFLNPGHPERNQTGSFWHNVTLFMKAAAKDLNIELVTIYAYRNHILMKSLVDKIINQHPEYVILVNEKGIALNIIKQVARYNVPMFMLLNTLSNEDLSHLSDKEHNLLKGSVIPDNFIVGKKLVKGLIKHYQTKNSEVTKSRSIHLLALQGDYSTPAALERKRGMAESLQNYSNVELIDSTVANWSKQTAYQKVKGILHHKRIDVIWAANDAMAFGAKKAVLEAKLAYPVTIGGVNWDVDDPQYPIDLSFGGHVALGALSLALLRDNHEKNLALNQKHQIIDIFESSETPHSQLFKERLTGNQLDLYDFSRFNNSSGNRLAFTIENLQKSSTRIKNVN